MPNIITTNHVNEVRVKKRKRKKVRVTKLYIGNYSQVLDTLYGHLVEQVK